MAKPTTLGFGSFKVYLGDGASPEQFTAPCGFTQKALNLSSASSDTLIPDCDDPTAPAWTEREVSSLSAQIQGSGVMALESLATWREWWESGLSKNIRVEFDTTSALNGGYYEGPGILSNLGFSTQLNQDGNKVQQQITIDNASAWTWTDATP